jgi:hypothetical protein
MVLLRFTLQLLGLWVTENYTRMQLGPLSYLDNKLIIFNAVNIEVTTTVSTKFHLHQKIKGNQNKRFSWFNCIELRQLWNKCNYLPVRVTEFYAVMIDYYQVDISRLIFQLSHNRRTTKSVNFQRHWISKDQDIWGVKIKPEALWGPHHQDH